MKISVTGHKGKIGSELIKLGYEPLECDITNLDQINDAIHSVKPDVIIHCAALSDVAYCEENQDEAFAVNARGVANMLYDFQGIFIYLGTVHVFDGQKYWNYSERQQPNPVNTYGFTKWSGEIISTYGTCRSVVVRISRTFSKESIQDTLYNLQNGESQEFPTFIKRSFNHVFHCAEGISWLAENVHKIPDLKLVNIAGTDTLSYYQLWQWVARTFDYDEKLIVPRKHEIDLPPRPFRGGLSTRLASKLGIPLYSAIDGLKLIKEKL